METNSYVVELEETESGVVSEMPVMSAISAQTRGPRQWLRFAILTYAVRVPVAFEAVGFLISAVTKCFVTKMPKTSKVSPW